MSSSQAALHIFSDRRGGRAPLLLELLERRPRHLHARRGVDAAQVRGQLLPVLAGGVAQCGADQVDAAREVLRQVRRPTGGLVSPQPIPPDGPMPQLMRSTSLCHVCGVRVDR